MKKPKFKKLDINDRPRFGAYNAIIKTKIDKENSRQNIKLKTKKELNELEG